MSGFHARSQHTRSTALVLAALFLRTATQLAVFAIGAAALALLLIGIHNAWDTVTHIVVAGAHGDATKPE